MNIHEYQAKELLEKYGVATPGGKVAGTPAEARQVAASLDTHDLVIKAQIHAGGRGKGTFKSGFEGGVHLADNPSKIKEIATRMLGETLVTKQTGEAGRVVNQVLVAQSVNIKRELYFAILLDRDLGVPVIIASKEGGVNIEEVAEENPDAIMKEPIHPGFGLQPFQCRKLAHALGFEPDQLRPASKLFHGLYNLFIGCDCSMVEINPLVETETGKVMALDAKINFDDNALYRHPNIMEMRDTTEEDPREVRASESNLSYIGLDGNIACLVNGAGLAMATMDIIQHYGGSPANFLDVGGGANEQQVTEAFKILTDDPNVKAILVNIFGGIMKCDTIAAGIIAATKAVGLKVPLVVRLEGTNVEAGKTLLEESDVELITADDLADAAQKVVKVAEGA